VVPHCAHFYDALNLRLDSNRNLSEGERVWLQWRITDFTASLTNGGRGLSPLVTKTAEFPHSLCTESDADSGSASQGKAREALQCPKRWAEEEHTDHHRRLDRAASKKGRERL
jgi:hypothetical protein